MQILITGATGYIGRRVVRKLSQSHSHNILTINRDVEKAKSMLAFDNCTHVTLQDKNAILAFQPEVVLHLATFSTSSSNTEIIAPIIDANITYGVKLLDILTQASSIKMFVNVGTFAEYRLGPDKQKSAYLYSATKSAFRHFLDFYADAYAFKYITAVPYTVYGGEDTAKKLIDYMVDSIDAPTAVDMTKGEQVLDFIHVDDVVNFFLYIVENHSSRPSHEEIHLGTGVGTRVRDLATLIEETHQVRCNINWGGREYRPLDVMRAVAPHNNIAWKPSISLQQGVQQIMINK